MRSWAGLKLGLLVKGVNWVGLELGFLKEGVSWVELELGFSEEEVIWEVVSLGHLKEEEGGKDCRGIIFLSPFHSKFRQKIRVVAKLGFISSVLK